MNTLFQLKIIVIIFILLFSFVAYKAQNLSKPIKNRKRKLPFLMKLFLLWGDKTSCLFKISLIYSVVLGNWHKILLISFLDKHNKLAKNISVGKDFFNKLKSEHEACSFPTVYPK